MELMNRRARPPRSLLVAAFALLTLIWGTTWAAIRIGLEGIPPFTGVSVRFAIAAAAIAAYARLRGIPITGDRRGRRLWAVTGGLAFCASYGVIYWGEQWVPSGLAAVLFATYPLFVAVLAHFLLRNEPLGRGAVAGILLGLGGAAVIFSEDLSRLGGPRVALASAVVLLSPLASALSSVLVKRWGEGVHPVTLTAIPMAFTALVMGALALAAERGRTLTLDASSVGALIYLAIVGTSVTFLLYYWLLSHARATRVALMAYLIPVTAVGIGITFLDEPLTGRILAGSALVIAGVALAVHSPHRP